MVIGFNMLKRDLTLGGSKVVFILYLYCPLNPSQLGCRERPSDLENKSAEPHAIQVIIVGPNKARHTSDDHEIPK